MKITIILNRFNTLNGEHPLNLRIAQGKSRKLTSLGVSCSPELWDFNKNAPKRNHPNKVVLDTIITQTIHAYRTKYLELVSQGVVVTPDVLVQAIKTSSRKEEASKVFSFFDQVIDRFLQVGKVGSAKGYKDTKRSLKLFTTSTNLLFTDIDQTFLNNYEVFLRRLGLAETSMAVYFRTLRALFNKAIQEKLVDINYYPFKEFSVAKFNLSTKKRALTEEELKKIENLELDPVSSLSESRRIFIFIYYGLGINFIDIAQLQWKDLIQGRIFYTRAKTGKKINFKLFAPTQAIIEHYRPLTGSHPDNYIFPILNRLVHITPTQIYDKVAKARKKMNSDMRKVAELAEVDANPTTYVGRHTCATNLYRKGVPMAKISQGLSHSLESTTRAYLKEFEDEEMDRAHACLL
jgi:integrase